MTYRIISIAPEYIASFREAADAVFRESQMFAFLEAPPLEQFTEFVHGVIRNKEPQFVAITDERVIGWCDVLMKPRPAMRHSGALGLGVLSSCRGKGVGTALLRATLDAATQRGLTRIELFVRTDNDRAKRLYERAGFTVEGTLRRHLLIEGVYLDSYLMSLLYDQAQL
jgi:RimJ/RimL family protein N-acetyltransferase